ncbi:MAG: GGDEF domain-containing protein [Pirellulales bacterium]|nr:GGDEF domain-containing protein [Pirellulales bacterium]
MNHPISAQILLLARRPDLARSWSTMLTGDDCLVWRAREDVPEGVVPEVLLTDWAKAEVEAFWPDSPVENGDVPMGVIHVGSPDGSCDVLLPPEPSPGELRLACRLLAEVVRLRRSEQVSTQAQHKLRQKALTDPLTGLPNRRAWDAALDERLAAARNTDRTSGTMGRLCVAVADLDHFKQVNDTDGHAAGDRVLAAVGAALRAQLRQADFIARLGGDEFGLLLDVPGAATAAMILDRLRDALAARIEQDTTHRVTTSIGWQLVPATGASAETLFAQADKALRQAKQAGRNRVRGG